MSGWSTRFSFVTVPRYLVAFLKVSTVLVFAALLYYTLAHQKDLGALFQTFIAQLDISALPYLILVCLLMIINWWLESKKWQLLIVPIEVIPLVRSIRAVLVGVTTSIFTPNRLGEYVGRVFFTTQTNRWKATAALSLGSMLQMAMIGCLGLLSLQYWIRQGEDFVMLDDWSLLGVLLIVTSLFFGYFFVKPIVKLGKRHFQMFRKIWPEIVFLTEYSFTQLLSIFLYTFIRILIYISQYALLMLFFGIEVPLDLAICAICITYLIQSGLPLPTLMGLLARGEITLFIWKYIAVNELSILATSYGLWVINVVIPALVGMIFILNSKANRTH